MSFAALSAHMIEAIEAELRRVVQLADGERLAEFQGILAYHLGWEGEGAGPEARGKRIRPILLLLACASASGDWHRALPAAAAVELIHNFSLIHDDIQDNSPLRRGRPTVWKRWGIPQAINSGDAMLTMAHLSALRLANTISAEVAIQAATIFQQACLQLTKGQYLDLSYENRRSLSLDDYWPMVSGKTAALLSSCAEVGALTAQSEAKPRAAYRQFGLSLGLAFQVQDDILGIWGDAASTGKSVESDLLAGKKSLPVLFGLRQDGAFARRWLQGPLQVDEIAGMAAQLDVEGGHRFAQETANRLTTQALQALGEAEPQGEAGQALSELADDLLRRQG
ncbi:MAG TPA: polyprenyl synthetase family protein [Anaerolineales bacterium]|nr:polyprenyl synthetase family protein [Anaerolineales bacterium]